MTRCCAFIATFNASARQGLAINSNAGLSGNPCPGNSKHVVTIRIHLEEHLKEYTAMAFEADQKVAILVR